MGICPVPQRIQICCHCMKTDQAVWGEEGLSGIPGEAVQQEQRKHNWDSEGGSGILHLWHSRKHERAQHGAWQVREVHRMSVLSSVPEIRSSGGRGGIRTEVPAQHSGAVTSHQVAGRIGVAKGKW